MQRALSRSRTTLIACLFLAGLGSASLAHADGVLTLGGAEPLHLFPEQVAVEVEVRAQVESTAVTLTFERGVTAGDWVLTLASPEGGYVVDLEVDLGAGLIPAEMTAEPPPPSAGSSGEPDEAMDAWVGDTPLTATLTLPATERLVIRARFQRLLRRYQEEVRFEVGAARCPLRPAAEAGARVSIDLVVKSFRDFARFEASGLPGAQVSRGERVSSVSLIDHPLDDAALLDVSYSEQSDGVAVHFLTHRTPTADPLGGEQGYFLMIADANAIDVLRTPPRSISLVVDKSGSMSGDKIEQAREAAHAMLDTLRPDDTFNLHLFDAGVYTLFFRPVVADEQNVAQARAFIDALRADGSTNLNDAVLAGLGGEVPPQSFGPSGLSMAQAGCGSLFEPSAPPAGRAAELDGYTMPPADIDNASTRYDAMVLLSDGQPTAGVTDPEAIFVNARTFNTWDSRIFTVAVGAGADIPLLESLARDARGRNIVLNNRQAALRLTEVVQELFEDIEAVRVTDIDVTLDDIAPAELFPELVPDLFNGGQVLLVGRYSTPGSGALRVTGQTSDHPLEWSEEVMAPELVEDNAFIKYVWATEKVGALLAEMSRGGDEEELKAQIIELGLGYRIQTPYTSFNLRGDSEGAYASMDAAGCGCGLLDQERSAAAIPMIGLLVLTLCFIRLRRAS